jgi:hypothetical protein
MLRAGVEEWNVWRRTTSIATPDLREADLYRVSLTGANLRGVDLIGANLRQANLSQCDLRQVNLHRADLRQADLVPILSNIATIGSTPANFNPPAKRNVAAARSCKIQSAMFRALAGRGTSPKATTILVAISHSSRPGGEGVYLPPLRADDPAWIRDCPLMIAFIPRARATGRCFGSKSKRR